MFTVKFTPKAPEMITVELIVNSIPPDEGAHHELLHF